MVFLAAPPFNLLFIAPWPPEAMSFLPAPPLFSCDRAPSGDEWPSWAPASCARPAFRKGAKMTSKRAIGRLRPNMTSCWKVSLRYKNWKSMSQIYECVPLGREKEHNWVGAQRRFSLNSCFIHIFNIKNPKQMGQNRTVYLKSGCYMHEWSYTLSFSIIF